MASAPAQTISETPILDGLAPMPQRPTSAASTFLQMIIGVATGALLYKFGIRIAVSAEGEQSSFLLLRLLLDFFVAIYVSIIIHECGHLIAGLAVGLRVNFIRFGRLQINAPFRLSFWPTTGTGASGMASLLPNGQSDLHRSICVMLLGGPLANIVAALAIYGVFRPLTMFTSILGLFCTMLGIFNLIPFARRAAVSDGKRILMVLRRSRQGERYLAIRRLAADLWNGVPPENLDATLIRGIVAFSDKLPDTVSAHLIAYRSAFHGQRDPDAARLLETALQCSAGVGIATRQELIAQAAIFQARRAHKPDSAQKWLQQLSKKTHWPGLRQQAEAAILEGQSQLDAAAAKLDESTKLASAMPPGMERAVALLALERWKKELMVHKTGESASTRASGDTVC